MPEGVPILSHTEGQRPTIEILDERVSGNRDKGGDIGTLALGPGGSDPFELRDDHVNAKGR